MKNKVLLIVLDGFGIAPDSPGNGITRADLKYYPELMRQFPSTQLEASGTSVGLPKGRQGNSEVGHLHLGAGRVVYQPMQLIDNAIADESFFENPVLLQTIAHAKQNNSAMHVMGLMSDEGVHGTIADLFAFLDLCKRRGLTKVYYHAILDGRDVPQKSAAKYMEMVLTEMKKIGIGKVATIVGRFYAMDRDKNWERTKVAYELMTLGNGIAEKDPLTAIQNAYARADPNDYYVKPMVMELPGDERGLVSANDALFFYDYRTDRSRQITQAFTQNPFVYFPRKLITNLFYAGMTEYDETFGIPFAFQQQKVTHNLGQIVSAAGLRQMRIAETEKYAHVTYFFNSQIEKPYLGEDRILIPSKKVPSYDQAPAMSADDITLRARLSLGGNKYSFILVNYANPDLVGHSGNLKAVIRGVQVVDACLSRLIPDARKNGFQVIVTADHGNAEDKILPDGRPNPSHSTNPVPFLLIPPGPPAPNLHLREGGSLIDVAPTVLELLELPKPREMTGQSLLERK